jgi:hypothetical protein
MRYDVYVSDDGTRFKIERDEPLVVGERLIELSMLYEVTKITRLSVDESEDFNAIAEVTWRGSA